MKKDYSKLIEKAFEAQKNSYSPYSNFKVGAALLTKSGNIYVGTNIENAAYSPSNCGERTTMFSAVANGEKDFVAIAVVCDGNDYCFPCGVCRQVMVEFNPDMEVVCVKNKDDYKIYKAKELLPNFFGPKSLK